MFGPLGCVPRDSSFLEPISGVGLPPPRQSESTGAPAPHPRAESCNYEGPLNLTLGIPETEKVAIPRSPPRASL